MSQIFTILFDLDGTLVDTAPDLMLAHNHVMKKFGYPTKSTEEIRNLVGQGAGAMLGRSIWGQAKKSTLGKKSKANHLTYIGDSQIGKSVNVGAGTITCNYDGLKKSKTVIKDGVFIGSNSSLVAPITISDGSVIGAGSVITKNVKKKSLALTRTEQIEVKNYKRKKK